MKITIIDCFDTWEHRVDLLFKVLTQEGHKVQVLMSDYQHIEKCRRLGIKKNFNFFTAEPYKKNISIKRLHSHIQLSQDMFGYVEDHEKEIDLLWVLIPPNYFVKNAGIIKRHYPHIKLIIDVIDLWPETMPIGILRKVPIMKIWKMIRNENLKDADVVVTECGLYKKVLGKAIDGLKIEKLYLAREDKGYEPHINLPSDCINLCYLGSINNIIDINIIGEIIKTFRKQRPVKLIIIGDGEKKYELCRAAEEAGALIVFLGVIYDRVKKQKIFDSCHYGLNIMKSSVCVGLTMKSIDYFEFGLPIINNIKGDTWNAIEKYGCGVNWNKTMEITYDDEMRIKCRNFFRLCFTENVFRNKVNKIIEND